MSENRVPDPTLMARLQLSVKGVDWAASLVRDHQHRTVGSEWSPHQHLFHLVANETAAFQPRIELLLEKETAEFERWDSADHMHRHYHRTDDITVLADRFMAERERTVALLKGANRTDWQRTATWPDGRIIDLAWLAERVLSHALDHFACLLDLHGEFTLRQAAAWFRTG